MLSQGWRFASDVHHAHSAGAIADPEPNSSKTTAIDSFGILTCHAPDDSASTVRACQGPAQAPLSVLQDLDIRAPIHLSVKRAHAHAHTPNALMLDCFLTISYTCRGEVHRFPVGCDHY